MPTPTTLTRLEKVFALVVSLAIMAAALWTCLWVALFVFQVVGQAPSGEFHDPYLPHVPGKEGR